MHFFKKKKFMLMTALTAVVALMVISFKPVDQQPKTLKNIKVFPASFTYEQVDHAMDQFKVDLGVKCGYCHAPSKDNPRKMDMASDENPRKNIARDMMRMTEELNKKYISLIPHSDSVKVQMVTCNTCHRGAGKPFGAILPAEKWGPPPPNGGTPPLPPNGGIPPTSHSK